MIKKTGLVLILISTVFTCAEDFTVKRNRRGPSLSKLKETCCEECATLLKLLPDFLRSIATLQKITAKKIEQFVSLMPEIIQHIADTQEVVVCTIEGYWQSDKKTLCYCATREQLESCIEKLSTVSQSIASCSDQMQKYAQFPVHIQVQKQKELAETMKQCNQLLQESNSFIRGIV